jgi:hypothetical protein
MDAPIKHTEVRTLGELRAAIADYPDDIPVHTDCSLSVVIEHWAAEPASEDGDWDAMPERLDFMPSLLY